MWAALSSAVVASGAVSAIGGDDDVLERASIVAASAVNS